MSTGKFKFWDSKKAFGFIIDSETKEEIFTHISGLKDRSYDPQQGDEVEFDITDGKRGNNAVNVEVV